MARFPRWLAVAALLGAFGTGPAAAHAGDDSLGLLRCAITDASGMATGSGGIGVALASGPFGFTSSRVVCGGADVAGSNPGAVLPGLPGNFSVAFGTPPPPAAGTTAGDFTSNVCGVGRAEGTVRITGNGTNTTDLTGLFAVEFAGALGYLTFVELGGVLDLDIDIFGPTAGEDVDLGEGDGGLLLLPQQGLCIGQGGFRVDGAFDLRFSGGPGGS